MAGVGTDSLDRRLLRFRTSPSAEDGRAFARELASAGRSADAIEVAGYVLADEPEDAAMQMLVGQAWSKEGDFVRAQKALLEALRLAPTDKEPYRLLADVLMKRGDPARAIKVLDRGLAIDPNDPAIRSVRARAERLLSIATTGGTATEAQIAPMPEPPRPRAAVSAPPPAPAARSVAPAPARPAPSARPAAASYKPPAPVPALEDEDWESEATVIRSDLSEQLSQHMAAREQRRDETKPTKTESAGPARGVFIEEPTRPISFEALGIKQDARLPATRTETPSDRPTRIMQSYAEAPVARSAPPPPRPPAPASQRPPPALPPTPAVPQRAQAPVSPQRAQEPQRPQMSAPVAQAPSYAPPQPPRPQSQRPPAHRPSERPRRGAPAQDDVDGVLNLLQRTRIFEPFIGENATWVVPTRAERAGSRIGRAVIVVWVLGLLAVGGGYAGYRHHDQQQRARAGSLVTQAETLARIGEHQGLVEAHTLLQRARRLSPVDKHRAEVALATACQRTLEEGDVPAGVLLATIDTTTQARPDDIYVKIARGVAAWARGDRAKATKAVRDLTPAVQRNGTLAYLLGRLAQRVGDPSSRALLEKAVALTPDFPPAQLALASADAEEQHLGDAIARVDSIVTRHRTHVRARLFRALFRADELEPTASLATIQEIEPSLRKAGSTDRVLAALVRARAYRRSGDDAAAGRAVDTAVSEGGTNARLLLLVSREAIALGHLSRAAQAATAALLLAPHLAEGRRVLGEVHVRRRDGLAALNVLGTLPATDVESRPWVARGLLLVAPLSDEPRARALELVTQLAASTDSSERAIGLRLRVATDPSSASAALAEAKTLARSAPGVPEVMRAVGEIALVQGDQRAAVDAGRKLVTAEPRSVESAILLGRALSMSRELDEARVTFTRAVSLDPTDPEALAGLADTELGLGAFAEADAHFAALTRLNGSTRDGTPANVGRLGRAEALIGLGRVADARMQLEGLSATERSRPRAQIAAARLALVDGHPGEAVALLRTHAEPESASLEIIALYGDALLAVGEQESAGAQFERVLGRNEAHPEGLLGMATLQIRAGDHRDASETLGKARRALEEHPRGTAMYARLLMLIGRAEFEQGNIEQARTFLRQATQREGVPAEAWFHLGQSLAGANSPDARTAYERYLALDPNGPYGDRARRAIR